MQRLRLIWPAMCLVAVVLAPPPAAAEARTAAEDRAIEIALDHPDVQDRLGLRRGPYSIRVSQVDVPDSLGAFGYTPGTYTLVQWRQQGRIRVDAVVDVDRGAVQSVHGQALVVMPHSRTSVLETIGDPRWNVPLLLAFLVVLALGPRDRWYLAAVAAPLAAVSAAYVWTVANALDEHLRTWSMLQYGIPVVAMVGAATAWLWRAGSDRAPTRSRGVTLPAFLSALACAAGLAFQGYVATKVRAPIDVAYASQAGADLIGGGVSPYGNILDIPGVLLAGDTYGPMAYLAYVPGAQLFDDVPRAVLGTNLVATALVALLLLATGRAVGNARGGAWAAAAWSLSPVAVLGGASGHNDILPALATATLLVCLHRPAWRGVVVAAAAATKLLPVLMLAGAIRSRAEGRRAAIVALAAFTVATALLWGIGLQDAAGVDAFVEGARFQASRDDIASFWGLAGLSGMRHAALALAVAFFLAGVWKARRGSSWTQLACALAPLAVALVALPQFWFSYVAAVVPGALALAFLPDEPPVRASAVPDPGA